MIRLETVHFDEEGRGNTDEVLRIAKHRAQDLGIKTVLVASVTGETALRASETPCESAGFFTCPEDSREH